MITVENETGVLAGEQRMLIDGELPHTSGEVLAQCGRTAPSARAVIKSSPDNYMGLYNRIGMQSSLGAPESVERIIAFKARRSPDWVDPALTVDGRLRCPHR